MLNIYQFNNVIYNGNINRDFYLFVLKDNFLLIRYLFYNIYNYILSKLFKKYKNRYEKNRYKYFKDIPDLEETIIRFYERNKYNSLPNKANVVIDRVPSILIEKKIADKIISYELNSDCEVELTAYEKAVKKETKATNLYIRKKDELKNIDAKKVFIVKNNKFKYLEQNR